MDNRDLRFPTSALSTLHPGSRARIPCARRTFGGKGLIRVIRLRGTADTPILKKNSVIKAQLTASDLGAAVNHPDLGAQLIEEDDCAFGL